jgi:uncharacterized membrane protein
VFLTGAVMLALPHLSPRGVFFGARVGEDFASSGGGRGYLRVYRTWVVLFTLAGAAVVALAGHSALALIAGALIPQVAALAFFLRNHLVTRHLALSAPRVPEAKPGANEDGLPVWATLAAPPFVLPVAAMLYLRNHWEQIPERYAVHFGANGEPNRWVNKSARAVYAPLWFAEGMMLLMLLLGAAMLLGSRKGVQRAGLPQVLVAVIYLMSAIFSMIGIGPLVSVPPLAIIGTVAVFVVGLLIYSLHKLSKTPAESTPDECWTLGGIYNNPDDPALFVQKRIGYGFTINFGNKWSWAVIGGFFMGVGALTAYLIWAQSA